MAITASYWRAWQLLLIMTAHNPEEFGSLGWENYPTLRAMMEMCITSQFVFPPPTLASNTGLGYSSSVADLLYIMVTLTQSMGPKLISEYTYV
jgi:hypothetical protein